MYDIREDAYITFALKEFRAIASLAEAVNEPLELRFTRAGEPLFVDVVSSAYADVSVSASAATPSIRCEMVLATSDQQAPDVMDNSSAAPQPNGHHAYGHLVGCLGCDHAPVVRNLNGLLRSQQACGDRSSDLSGGVAHDGLATDATGAQHG